MSKLGERRIDSCSPVFHFFFHRASITVQSLAHHWHDVTGRQKTPHNYHSRGSRFAHLMDYIKSIGDYSLLHSGSLNMLMTLTSLLSIVFLLELCAYSWAEEVLEKRNPSDFLCICNEIAAAISGASQVFFPREFCHSFIGNGFDLMGDQAAPEYTLDISHVATSSSQESACSVEPGSADDVSKIVSHPYSTNQHCQTHVLLASYSGIDPNTIWGEMWRTHYKPGILLDERCRDCHDALQRDNSKFNKWHS